MDQTQALVTGNGDQTRVLIVIFLRGAADGLTLVAPLQDDDYYRSRPLISLARNQAIALDGFFGLNPLLKELMPAYDDGQMAIVHAAGSEDTTRSHFEAQALMEHGGIAAGGWLGRFLRYGNASASSALAAVAMGTEMPECLRGAPAATVLQSLDQFSMGDNSEALTQQLKKLYEAQRDELASAGRDTLDALDRISSLRRTDYRPAHGATYAADGFSQRLKQLAQLIKARVGLEAASVDLEGWDSHFAQSSIINPLMVQLSQGIGAFYRDLGPLMATTSVVVMTEFGRRVQENSSFGTDHGRGSVMFILGGGVKGKRVVGDWPGLKPDVLEGPGDLTVVHNYRNVLAPVLRRHGAGDKLNVIFPDFNLEEIVI
jgi:uncharacterized protein (DUF1501 family)